MRNSLRGMEHMIVLGKSYPGVPDELLPFEVYLKDSGYCILCVPNFLVPYAKDRLDDFEVAVPTKYVLCHPYSVMDGYVYIDVPYDQFVGVSVPDEFYAY